jgi:hypothetical protein
MLIVERQFTIDATHGVGENMHTFLFVLAQIEKINCKKLIKYNHLGRTNAKPRGHDELMPIKA